jgi:hypothetical protein
MGVLRGTARLILKAIGWKLIDLPQRPAKAVVIAYPHTSNWDFPMTMLALAALPYGAQWVAKDTLFRGMLRPHHAWPRRRRGEPARAHRLRRARRRGIPPPRQPAPDHRHRRHAPPAGRLEVRLLSHRRGRRRAGDHGGRSTTASAKSACSPPSRCRATKPPTWRGFSRNGDPLVQGASLQIHPGWKVGLTGANGCGKSSFFALLRGELHAERATSRCRPRGRSPTSARRRRRCPMPRSNLCSTATIELRGDRARTCRLTLAEARSRPTANRSRLLHGRLQEIGGYAARARAAELLHGLGFTDADFGARWRTSPAAGACASTWRRR